MRATLRLELRNAEGHLVEERRAKNSVMRDGAKLIAALFTGTVASGITHMAVGTSAQAEDGTFVRDALTTAGDQPGHDLQNNEAAIAPGDFVVKTDEARRLVIVQVNATVPKNAAVGTLREAGLVAHGAQ